jgi:hypothetical protein
MRALETEVVDAVWAAVEPLLPTPPMTTIGSVATGPGSRIGCASRES